MFFTHHLVQGGAEKTVRTLFEYINAHFSDQYTSYICVVYDDPEAHPQLSNVVVLPAKSQPSDSKAHKACNVLRQIREIHTLKKNLKIDVCISFLPGADIINVLSGTGEKQIVSVRTSESAFTHSVFKKIYVETSYRKCDRIIAVSEMVRNDCIQYFHVSPDKIISIPNSVTVPPAGPGIDEKIRTFIGKRRLIITTGRLNPEKGIGHLIRAYASVRDRIPDTCLLILGDGPLKNSFQQLIQDLCMQDFILLPGHRSNPQDYLQKADLFILPSPREGMSNSLLEAMASGLPVISARNGSEEILRGPEQISRDIRPDKLPEYAAYGVLVPAEDEESLADSIKILMQSPSLREKYARQSLLRAQAYDIRLIAARWISEIETTLNG